MSACSIMILFIGPSMKTNQSLDPTLPYKTSAFLPTETCGLESGVLLMCLYRTLMATHGLFPIFFQMTKGSHFLILGLTILSAQGMVQFGSLRQGKASFTISHSMAFLWVNEDQLLGKAILNRIPFAR